MGKIITWLLTKVTKDFLIMSAYYAFIVVYISTLLAMFSSLVIGFFYFYDLIQTFLDMAGGQGLNSGLQYIDYMYGLLDCIGFTSALNNSKSLLLGAVTFILARVISQASYIAYRAILSAISPLVSK